MFKGQDITMLLYAFSLIGLLAFLIAAVGGAFG